MCASSGAGKGCTGEEAATTMGVSLSRWGDVEGWRTVETTGDSEGQSVQPDAGRSRPSSTGCSCRMKTSLPGSAASGCSAASPAASTGQVSSTSCSASVVNVGVAASASSSVSPSDWMTLHVAPPPSVFDGAGPGDDLDEPAALLSHPPLQLLRAPSHGGGEIPAFLCAPTACAYALWNCTYCPLYDVSVHSSPFNTLQ